VEFKQMSGGIKYFFEERLAVGGLKDCFWALKKLNYFKIQSFGFA
jgi:hypothetical protein